MHAAYDAVGRPVDGPDGAYTQSAETIRLEADRMAGLVREGAYPVSLLAAYLGDTVNRCEWAATLLAEVRAEVA